MSDNLHKSALNFENEIQQLNLNKFNIRENHLDYTYNLNLKKQTLLFVCVC